MSDPVEYIVEKVLDCREFEELVQKALRSEYKFNPSCLEDETRHSKYAYLVHWQDYPKNERTWEPESALLQLQLLADFKEEHGMPPQHETFEKTYGSRLVREVHLAADRVEGFRYLLTKEERRREKEERRRKKEERDGRLAEMNEAEKKKKEKPRMRMDTPEDVEETVLRKKKEEKRRKEEKSQAPVVARINAGKESSSTENSENLASTSTSSTSERNPPLKVKMSKPLLPGMNSLDANTPRIQKKTTSVQQSATPQCVQATVSVGSPRISSESFGEEPSAKRAKRVESNESIETIFLSSSSSNSTLNDSAAPSRVATPEDALELEAKIKEKQERLLFLERKLRKCSIRVSPPRVNRSLAPALHQRILRRSQSGERLANCWDKNSDMEIFSRNYDFAYGMQRIDEVPVIKSVTRDDSYRIKPGAVLNTEEMEFEKLNKRNWEKMCRSVKFDDQCFKDLLEKLVKAYSYDDCAMFEKHFREGMTSEAIYDAYRYKLIVYIITFCKHRYWTEKQNGFHLVESNFSEREGAVRKHQDACSEQHRKCNWMELFFKLLPARTRFLETSSRQYNGLELDGPFRDDMYYRCMQEGAECQKALFFKYNKPIGIQEETVGDYIVDAMHMLVVQRGNIQRIASYIADGGLDINAIATHVPSNRAYDLKEYLQNWILDNCDVETRPAEFAYYQDVLKFVRLTSERLDAFSYNHVTEMLAQQLASRWSVGMYLSPAHFIRCSPLNNASNHADGSNQVLSCLFFPLRGGYRDGLDEAKDDDATLINDLRSDLRKYRQMVVEKKGRLVVAITRIEVHYQASTFGKQPYAVPEFRSVCSDEGFSIERVNLLRQTAGLSAEEAEIGMWELSMLSRPGSRYFGVREEQHERKLVVPGNAHIEMIGQFDEPMTFLAQVFFIKRRKNY